MLLTAASAAVAVPSKSSSCTNCHDGNTAVKVTATQTANDGTTATYSVSVSNPYGGNVTGWAVFSGTTNLKHGYGSGSFSVPVDKDYRVWGVAGSGGKGANYTTVSPASKPKPVMTGTSTPVVPYLGKARLTGTLKASDGTALVGETVALQTSVDGTSWKSFDTTVTASDGAFALDSPALVTARYVRARYTGGAEYAASASTPTLVKPRIYYSSAPKFSTYTHTYGTTYTVRGFIKPKHADGSHQIKVKAYRKTKQADGTYKYVLEKTYSTTISNSSGSSYSTYKGHVKLPSKGKWRLRAYHAADSKNAKSYSSYRYVTVE